MDAHGAREAGDGRTPARNGPPEPRQAPSARTPAAHPAPGPMAPGPRAAGQGTEPAAGEPSADGPPAAVDARPVPAPRSEPGAALGGPSGAAVVRGAAPSDGPGAGVPTAGGAGARARAGIGALSPGYQAGVVLALAGVAVAVCVHLGMVFLHVAPSNTVSRRHAATIDAWVYPEFEQNWKLFAPNPLQQNVAVQVRARIGTADGGRRVTGWHDLSAQDGRAIDANPLPSHTQQNELRRAWDFFLATHDADNRPSGERGLFAESYLRRIAVLRLDRAGAVPPGAVVERVQVRSRTVNVPPPRWSGEQVSPKPVHRVLPWWTVSRDEAEGVVG